MTFGTRRCCQLSTYRKQLKQLEGSCWCLLSLLKVPPDSLLYASFWPLLPSFFLRLRLPQWHWGKTKIHIKKKLGSFCALLLPAPCSPGHAVYPLPYIHTVWPLCIRSCLLLGVCLTTNAAQLHLWQCLRALEEKRKKHNTLLQILKKKNPLDLRVLQIAFLFFLSKMHGVLAKSGDKRARWLWRVVGAVLLWGNQPGRTECSLTAATTA